MSVSLGFQTENSHVDDSADSQVGFSDKVNPALGFLVPDQRCHNHMTQSTDPVLTHIFISNMSKYFDTLILMGGAFVPPQVRHWQSRYFSASLTCFKNSINSEVLALAKSA